MDVVRRRVVVRGLVQDVWFRDSTRREATRLGLSGWVRNLADGSVEIEAEGPPAAVDELTTWARTGPPRADVTGIAETAIDPRGRAGFEVRGDGPPGEPADQARV